ncbi:transmembrane 4 L6 family member 4-like isoform X2 [Scyliorhinus canicula]|uniref:transmembrane 4 L6 family member 4-like isoform X2 n=1 Tax=Scyliorhinus canicula TaxID=7830 RepID=UPI0018F4CD03|nr:transmembrane 4 L6 family member 4-like isoform X2 [Scyliorhinus canicula]
MFLCSGTTARCLGVILLGLAILCFCVNVLLFFPNGDTRYAKKNVSSTVWYLGGVIGSGILLCTLIFTVLGVIGSAYGFIVSSVALDVGPLCRVTQLGEWRHPFYKGNYLSDPNLWIKCLEPENVIPWHVRLFSILLVTSAVQFIICVALLVNILFGMFCRDCNCFKGYGPM